MVELRSLVLAERVLDRQLVEPELVGELVQLLLGRAAEVDPDDGVGSLEVLGHVGDAGSSRPRATPLQYTPRVRAIGPPVSQLTAMLRRQRVFRARSGFRRGGRGVARRAG